MPFNPSLFVFLAGALTAEQASHDPGIVLRSTTRLVQVNVVAQDRQGRPVTDLTAADFTVQDNGKAQQIAVFSMEGHEKPRVPAAALPHNVFSNRLEQREGVPNSVTIILLDGLNTRWGDQMISTQDVVAFLRQIQPGDRVALLGLSRTLRVVHDYTSDSAALVKTLAAWQGSPDTLLAGLLGFGELEREYALEMRIKTTLKALEAISNHVARIPGRKNLVWVSAAFPLTIGFLPGYSRDPMSAATPNRYREPGRSSITPRPTLGGGGRQTIFGRSPATFDAEVTRAVRALNNANLAVYPVDARGLSTEPAAATNIGTMKELAGRTGGKAYYNRNDLRNSIREAVIDASVTYTLAYYPAEQKGDGEFRNIRVKVKRPGVAVRHRRGYFDQPDLDAADPTERDTALADAAWSPLDATSVRLDARITPVAGGRLAVETIIDPDSITLEPRNGMWHGKVDLLLLQTGTRGNSVDTAFGTFSVEAGDEAFRRKSSLVLRLEIAHRSEASALKIVVRDAPTGNVGSLSIPYSRIAVLLPRS